MTTKRRRSDKSGRARPTSPGRPPVARRADLVRLRAAIAAGRASEDAAMAAGLSPPVATRWFGRSGGMPPSHLSVWAKPLSGRYLSFTRREEIALLRAQGHGVRPIARSPQPCPLDDLARAATRSGHPERRPRGSRLERRGGTRIDPRDARGRRSSRGTRRLASPRAGPPRRPDHAAGRRVDRGGPPRVAWKGRRHGPRPPGRWARAWSPERIARRLRIDDPGEGSEAATMRMGREAIRQALHVQGRGAALAAS